MIPPEPMTRRRGRKTLLRRKEIGEEDKGFRNGRVKKTGVTMKCNICGTPGHNKRHHQDQQLCLGRGHINYLHGEARVLLLPQLNMAWRQVLVQILPRLKGKIKAREGKRHGYLQEHLLDIKTSVLRLLFFALSVHKLHL